MIAGSSRASRIAYWRSASLRIVDTGSSPSHCPHALERWSDAVTAPTVTALLAAIHTAGTIPREVESIDEWPSVTTLCLQLEGVAIRFVPYDGDHF